jgi:hypothetical protein
MNAKHFRPSLVYAIAMIVTCGSVLAQEPQTQISIVIHPSATPAPALRYRLLPSASEQTPGNAATQYLLAFYQFPHEPKWDDIDALLEQPIDKLDKAKAKLLLEEYAQSIRQVEIAAYRDQCVWDLPLQDQGINYNLPHLNPLRLIAMVLQVRAKLQLSEGKFDDAIGTIKLGLTIAHHLRNQSMLVQGLVEANIAQMQQIPGAPNLYWALANLPRPMIDAVSVTQVEQSLVEHSFPELHGRLIKQLDTDEMRAVMRHMKEFLAHLRQNPADENTLGFAATMAGFYTPAKQYLVDQGRKADEVQQMPVDSVLAIYLFDQYQRASDELYKWAGTPYWQAHTQLEHDDKDISQQQSLFANPLYMLLPGLNRAFERFALLDAHVAKVQCIEALRAYAAEHNGRLPASLGEVTDTPIPLNPMTGKPFGYEAHGKTATLRIEGFFPRNSPADQVIQISVEQ